MNNEKRVTLVFALGAALLAGAHRLLPPPWHPFNMTLLGALGLWGGARLRPWLGLVLPVTVWAVTDLVLWQITGSPAFNPFVYGSFLIYPLFGLLVRNTKRIAPVAGLCLAGSLQFYLLTNFSAWLQLSIDPAELPPGQSFVVQNGAPRYSANLEGLGTCYAFGLPFYGTDPAGEPVPPPLGFFGNLLAGDLAFCGLLFGVHALLLRSIRRGQKSVPVEVGSAS